LSARAALEARDLLVTRRSRSGAFTLRVDALDLRAGEVLAVIGPNGAGKSTLLRALAGLERPDRGAIRSRVTGPVTLVFQRPIPFAGTVAHNLQAALWGLRLPRDARQQRAQEALERFGIARLARRAAATLSGGELRRLALARAFALRPAVLLLDEPFDDLDAAGQESLSLDLRLAIADTDVAVAVVTHDLRRALLLADRVAVLLDGRVAQIDAREAVLERPLSIAVARQVGMTNLIPGEVASERGDGWGFVDVDAHHRIPALSLPEPGTSVCAGFRPEHLKIDVGRGDGISLGKARVRTLVSDGVAATVSLEWAGFELRTYLIAGRGPARTIEPGSSVLLSVRPEHVHIISQDGASTRETRRHGGGDRT
jgi:ABC-type sulfate/molybdate transport systems ATPase subunit